MGDIFNEQLVKRNQNSKDQVKKGLIIAGGVVVVVVGAMIPFLSFIMLPIALVVAWLVLFLLKRFNLEYEYIFTSGELDIDKIINRNKRKRVLSINVKDIELMAPVNRKEFERDLSKFNKLYDCGSGQVTSDSYAALFNYKNEKAKLIFEPNEKLLKAIRHYIPRQLKM